MLSYLIRLWAEQDNARWVWRISLQPIASTPNGAAPLGFDSLATAVAHLQAEMKAATLPAASGQTHVDSADTFLKQGDET